MTPLRELQASFMKYLHSEGSQLGETQHAEGSEIAQHIQSTPDATAQRRLDIYAIGYRLRLKEVITHDFDCLHGYLGDDLFDQLLECYITQYPSQHPSLRYFSQYLGELLSTQKPFADHPEIIEIAKIEHAFNHSFDAADCTTLSTEDLSEIAVESWPTLQIRFHDSVQLLPCKHNSFEIWKAISEENEPPELKQDNTTWLIWRKDLISRYRALDEAETYALTRLIEGGTFSDLCEGLLDYFDEVQTPSQAVTYLQTWLNEMMVCGFVLPPKQ
ncbi:MAG: DNA-binding domain-containing protein [Cocleimonas sp.]